ncbi:MAG TPA: cyclase family protein [Nordella sp.]|nr:cyclase family protein [Nordella sp.]
MTDKRVVFDFDVAFSNGGGIQGQGFRLDIDGDDIGDDALAAYIIKDLRLLMVGKVTILNKQIIAEPHKRSHKLPAAAKAGDGARYVDLSHIIESGMITYKGLPAPLVCDHISRLESRAHYAEGTEFQIGRIDMVANTGTYLDTPYHRYADGFDLAGLPLESASSLPGIVVRALGANKRAIDWTMFAASDVAGRAVLVHTGWDSHWRSDQYFEGHPFLTEAAAVYLRDHGARLVGIDSLNIDDTADRRRPVHSVLLAAGIPIVEHMTNLGALPVEGFRFHATPPKVARMGTFPVRAHAILD